TGSDLRARPRNPILATMAATVPIVGNRRENPSVYLRPIAQAGSHMPAMSRKSQAMGDPPYNVCSTQCLSTLSAVRAACPRKKDSAAKIINLKRRKQPISHEGAGFRDQICHRLRGSKIVC